MLPEGDAHRPAALAADGFTACSSGGHTARCVSDTFDDTNETCRDLWRRTAFLNRVGPAHDGSSSPQLFSRRLCVFARITPSSTFSIWSFVFDQADGNVRADTAEVAWRTAASEHDARKVRIFSSSRFTARSLLPSRSLASYFPVRTPGFGGQPPSDAAHQRGHWRSGVGGVARTQWLLSPKTVAHAESLQAHHAVHVNWLRLPLPLRLLCFGILCVCGKWRSFTASTVGPAFLDVMSACLGGYGGDCGRGCPLGEPARPLFRSLHARRSRLRAGNTMSRAN